MPNEEDRKWLYGQFKDNGYDTGSYEDFIKSLDNDEDFEWWHKEATSLGLEVGDLKEFGSLFRTPKEEEALTPEQTALSDEPDLRPLNEKARRRVEENARKEAEMEAKKEAEAAARREQKANAAEGWAMFDKMRQKMAGGPTSPVSEAPQAAKEEMAASKAAEEARQAKEAEDVQRFGTGTETYSADDAAYAGRLYEEISAENEALAKEIERYNKTGQGNYTALSERQRNLRMKTEELRNSAAWKEYNDLSDRYRTLSAATETPEIRFEKARLAAELSRNPIARVGMGNQAPSESQINFDLNRAEAEYIESQMETADRAKKKEYKARLKELNHEVLDNDYYQADVARRIAENDAQREDIYKRMTEIRERVMKEKSKLETLDDALLAEPEYQKLLLASSQLEQTGRKLAHIRDKNAGDFWVNFMDVFSDPNTYNFGITNLETALATKAAQVQTENDYMSPSSDGAVDLLSAVAGENAVAAEEGQFVEDMGKYGQIAAQSIPFMLQIGLTGGFGSVAQAVGSRFAKAVGKEMADKFLVKVTGAVLGDIAAGFVAANTIGGAKTMSDILNNYYGTLVSDGEGGFEYEGGQGLGRSVWGAEVGNTLEYASERAGDHMQRLLGKSILGWGIRSAQRNGKGAVNLAVEELAKTMNVTLKDFGFRSANQAGANWVQKAMGGMFKALNQMGVQGFPFEVAEEYVGLLGNIILGGEEKWMDFSKLGDKETHTDIWGGMLYSIGLTQAGAVSLGGVGAGVNAIRKAQAYHQLENALESNSNVASSLLGEDAWRAIKETIDGTTNKELPKKVVEYMNNQEYDPQQRAAILDYVKNTYLFRGFNAGTIAQARERISAPENLQSLNINAEAATAQDQISDAYMLGYQQSTEKRVDVEQADLDRKSRRRAIDAIEQREEIEQAVARQKAHMAELTGIADMSAEDASRLLADEAQSQEVRDSALDYLMALAVEQGFDDAENNRQLREKALIEGRLKQQYGKFYYENPFGESVVETSQTPNPATKRWENIFLLASEPNENGEVPFVALQTGRKGYVKRDQLAEYDDAGNIVPGLTKTQTLNEFLDEQYAYEQTQREAQLAQEDAEQTAQRQTEESQQAQQGFRSSVEGMEEEDGSFVYNGQRGRLIRKTDVGAVFEPEDGTDNVELTWEQLAQGTEMPAAEEPAAEPEPSEAPAEEPSEEPAEEAPKIPLDKDGNPIYDAPGVSVEDALADMYTTEGLDEADVDDYIINRAAEAEKGRAVKQGKMSLKEWGQKKKEANRIADFWGELAKFAEENKSAREKEQKEEAARQELIKKYGVDTSKFDLTPQTAEEAVADYLAGEKLINLDDAIRETLGRRKDNRIPSELFRHLGAHGILTKKGGLSVADAARDIVGEYGDTVAIDEDEARDLIINMLVGKTKSEIRDTIFNNRLEQARKEQDMFQDEEPEPAPAPQTEPAPAPEEEAEEEVPEDLPEEVVEEEKTTEEQEEEEPVAEPKPAGEKPEGQKPEGQGEKGGEKPGNAGNNGGNSVPLGEGKPGGQKPEGPAAPAAPAVPGSPAEIKDVSGARAFFEAKYGKGKKADTAVRVWELGHKTKQAPSGSSDNGPVSKMAALSASSGNPLSDEEVRELKLSAIEFAVDFVNGGAVKFPDFFKTMVETFGDNLRHYAKFLYNGTKMEVSDDVRKQMDSDDKVYNFDENIDLNDIGNGEDNDAELRDTGGSAGTETPGEGTQGNGGEAPGAGAESGNPGEDNPSEPVGGNGEGTEGGDNGVEPGGEGNGEGGEVVAGEAGEGTDEPNRGGQSGGRKSGGNGTGRGRNGGRRGKRKESGESSAGEEKGEGETAAGEEGTDVPVSGGENTEQKPGVTPEAQYAKEEQAAFEAESERIKDEEDTDKLKDLKNKLQEKIDAIKDRLDLVRAKLSGQLRAVLARLKDVFAASAKKAAQLAQEKIPYKSVADETGAHDIGNTVVPSGAGDAMRNAIKRVEQAVGKPIAEFVREELNYKSLDDMFTSISAGKFTGLASEQVDALGLAIYQMKTGKMFIVGDMTGVGKGRTAAGLIRWGLLHGKKVLFATQTPDLFSSMYEDLEDIGSKGLVPWIVNEDSKANIQKVDENDVSHVIVKHPGEEAAEALYSSGKDELPVVRRDTKNNGKRYQFVMTTYSQLYAGAEEKEGDSERVKKLNQRQEWGRKKAQWLKLYAKDAIVIMDESHNASGNSSRGNVFRDMVADAAGVTFLSATYAKRPQNMAIYALRSSMGDAMVSQAQMLQAIVDYGVPMQEMLAAALFETGEMVRRERDATGMYTHWVRPEEVYPEEELKRSRQMFDRTVEMVNKIIGFQRTYVNPIIEKMNKDVQGKNAGNMMMMLTGVTDDAYIEKYASTQYSSQVSRLTRAVMLAIKAKKAAEMAVKQIKDGNKPVIAIDETLETELKQLKKELGEDENADMSPDFGRILQKAIDFSLRYQHSTDHYKKVWNEKKEAYVPKKLPADRKVEKFSTIESYFGDEAFAALAKLREEVSAYGKEMLDMDLTLSPIDQMRKHITDAGYRVEEITGRKSRFVKKEDGKWAIEPMKVDKPRFRNRFNGGKASNPVPEEERLDCLIINRSGATGTNLHASKAFGDQKPRKMIIVEPAQNVDEEVQVRGRIDRTGQVHRGEYFYLVSPIPIESRFLMNLRRKLASLDASAVGTDKVSTNRVDVEDMENKYGDEIAKDFLSEHEEINDQMDNPITQDKKTKKWIGREGLMSDLLKAIQRMTCAEQEVTLQEIGEMYADKMEYLSQNGINDMTSTTMDLEAVTIDKAVIVKGKNNKSVSVFAHDTTIERVEVNNLTKPILSADIERQLKAVGAMTEDGKIDLDYGDRISAKAEEAKKAILAEKKRRYDEAIADYEANIRENTPQPEDMSDEDYEMEIRSKVDAKRNSLNNAYANDQRRLETQRQYVGYAARYLKPGRPYLVPLNESKDADTRYGRFLGFEAGKDGRASSVKAVFAVRDSRGKVSFPVAAMHNIIENLVNSAGLFGEVLGKRDSEYASKEEQMADWNQWWDRMTPKSNRTHRFMITGNILQAIGSLSGHRGSIVTFTRRDPETGEISIERGLLLAEDFDPDTFMVRTRVTKEDVWNAAGELADDLTRITVYRDGDNMVVKYRRENKDEKLSSSPLLKDKDLNELCETPFAPRGVEELQAVVPEKNVQKVLDMLYDNYNFTIGTLLVMPDSTEKPDRIVYTNKPHVAVINEIGPQFPRVHDADDADREVKNLMAQYRRDVTNEKIKERIQLLVQLRQAYIRGQYAGLDDGDLAWQAIIAMSQYNKYAKPIPGEKPEQAKARKEQMREYYNLAEAYKEELLSRGAKKGTAFHFKQGKIELSEIEKTFKKLNSDKDVAKVAEKVFAIARKIPRFEIFLNERIDTEVGGYTAGEAMSFNWNFMNEEIIPDQMKASTIVHELVHTATVYVYRLAIELNNDVILQAGLGDVMIELQSIYNAIRQNNVFRHQFGKYTWNTYTDYGIKNTKEMLSEAGANPKFRDLLKQVTLGVTARSGMITFTDVTGKDYTGKTQTAFDAIMERLDIILDSFDANAFNEAWTGTGYGGRSQYFRRAENLRNPIDRAAAIVKIGEIAKKLGVKFKEDPNLKAKGVFSPSSGEIRINIDAHADTADLEATLLHEAVAHYGLRNLFKEDWPAVRKKFYEQATDGIKAKVDAMARQYGLSKEVAMEEYIASLAEDGRFDQEEEIFWQRVVTAIKRMLHKLGFNAGRLTDEDFRALLYASFVNMRGGGPIESASKIATYQALRRNADASHEDNGPEDDGPDNGPEGGAPVSEDEETLDRDLSDLPEDIRKDVEDLETDQETEVLYRRASNSATAQTAAEMYGDKVRTVRSAVKEVLVDEMAPVDTLMDALATESGTKVRDDERVSDMIRETGGKAMQAVRDYDKKFLQPMWSAVGEFRKKTGESIKDTETYIGLKSGLERNIVLAKRDAKRDYQAGYDADIDEINQEEKARKKALDQQLKNGKISDVTYAGELTALQQEMKQKRDDAALELLGHFADVDAGTDKHFLSYREKDYSAITAWAETEDLEEAERLAGEYVADMESRAGKETTKELWKRINAATKETLKFQYEHQILSRQQYQDISKMMEYYVPMRGFSEDTAEDLFNYYVTPQSNDFQATVLTAKGRKTWYEGPLGNIGAMHSSAISQGVKNEAKLALLDAVRRRPKNTVATVTRAWFVKNGQKVNGKDEYDVAYPRIPENATLAEREAIIEQFEQDMADAKKNGDAYNSHREVDLHGGVVAFERQAHKNEHIVQVREGGKEYGVLINGNPAAAQAINGVRRGNGNGEKFLGWLRGVTRVLSSMFTTFSVPFWVSNFQRDHGQGLTNAFIRNNPGYVGRYIANRIRAAKLFPLILGSETMDNALAKGDPVAKLYKQYLDNGGPMGQNRIEDNEYFERQMKRYLSNSAKQGVIKGATAVLNIIGGVGEAIETITRFAVFMTSMESGRPIHESISDAKEISTNFARKGSGRSFSRDELDRMTHADGTKLRPVERGFVSALSIGVELCRASIPFFNAAVQGLENKVTNYREHTGKTLLADAIYLMLGFGMKMLLGNAGGDDDKEKYSHTSDYLRRNNILNPLGDGVYAKWALPQEYRVAYALGDILASAFQQERPAEDLGMDVFGAIMQLSPIGAVTDEVAFSAENKKKAYETLITNAVPGVAAPILESIFNMDFKGARIYNEGFNENLHAYPGWTKALPTTGSEYVAVAKWLNEVTGGNDVERGWVNINPAIVEHLVESYFSGPYQIVVRLPEAAVKIAKGEATVRDVPLLNRIILNTNDNQRDAYYNNMYYYFKEKNTEAERIHSEYKDRQKEGKVAEFYQSDNYKYMLIFSKYDDIERRLRKASRQMAEKGDKEKQKEYDERLQNVQYQIANECLNLYFKRNEQEEVK